MSAGAIQHDVTERFDRGLNRARLLLAALAIVFAWAGALGIAVWQASAASSAQRAQADAIADHELRLRAVEPRLERIERDVSWIRQHLGGGERGGP